MEKKVLVQDERDVLDPKLYKSSDKVNRKTWKNFTDFEIEENESPFVIVSNSKDDAPIIIKEEEGEKYYAEELYDEGEEIELDDIHDSEVVAEKRLSYKDIADSLDEAFASQGLSGSYLGLNLIASMQFSRLINLKPHKDVDVLVERMFNALNNPKFVVKYDPDQNISNATNIMEILNYAKDNPFKITFVYIKGVIAKDLFRYIRPFYSYIDNPNGDCFISAQGRSLYIPHNIYFMVSIRKYDVIYDTARRLLRYLGTYHPEVTIGAQKEELKSFPLDTNVMFKAMLDANEEYAVSEANWKKIDNVVEVIHHVNNYSLENKIMRRIEEFVVCHLANGVNEMDALDIALANNMFQEVLITTKPQLYSGEYNVLKEISGQFGNSHLPLTKEAVSRYLALFDKGGKRKNA